MTVLDDLSFGCPTKPNICPSSLPLPHPSRDTNLARAFELTLSILFSYSHVIFRIAPNTSARFRLEFDR
jgi:hypothetical protein